MLFAAHGSASAGTADTWCSANLRIEFLAADVVVTTNGGMREVWGDAGSLGTGIAGRLYRSVSGGEMGITFGKAEKDGVTVTEDGVTTTYTRCK